MARSKFRRLPVAGLPRDLRALMGLGEDESWSPAQAYDTTIYAEPMDITPAAEPGGMTTWGTGSSSPWDSGAGAAAPATDYGNWAPVTNPWDQAATTPLVPAAGSTNYDDPNKNWIAPENFSVPTPVSESSWNPLQAYSQPSAGGTASPSSGGGSGFWGGLLSAAAAILPAGAILTAALLNRGAPVAPTAAQTAAALAAQQQQQLAANQVRPNTMVTPGAPPRLPGQQSDSTVDRVLATMTADPTMQKAILWGGAGLVGLFILKTLVGSRAPRPAAAAPSPYAAY